MFFGKNTHIIWKAFFFKWNDKPVHSVHSRRAYLIDFIRTNKLNLFLRLNPNNLVTSLLAENYLSRNLIYLKEQFSRQSRPRTMNALWPLDKGSAGITAAGEMSFGIKGWSDRNSISRIFLSGNFITAFQRSLLNLIW